MVTETERALQEELRKCREELATCQEIRRLQVAELKRRNTVMTDLRDMELRSVIQLTKECDALQAEVERLRSPDVMQSYVDALHTARAEVERLRESARKQGALAAGLFNEKEGLLDELARIRETGCLGPWCTGTPDGPCWAWVDGPNGIEPTPFKTSGGGWTNGRTYIRADGVARYRIIPMDTEDE